MSLEEYLADQYNHDQQDINAIEQVLLAVGNTYAAAFDRKAKCWPYEIRFGSRRAKGVSSQGTTAMILSAVGKLCSICTLRNTLHSEIITGLPKTLSTYVNSAIQELSDALNKTQFVHSGTFGNNDPLTVSHLTEFVRGSGVNIGIPAGALDRIDSLLFADPNDEQKFSTLLSSSHGKAQGKWCAGSAFIALRIVRAASDRNKYYSNKKYKAFFETRLHDQLSFSSIPDSRFDPAELAFSLEGLLLCAREAVDPVLFRRVLTVLAETQDTSAYWRPNRPFVSNNTGEIILPLSVEGANSILYSVEIVDGRKLYDTFALVALQMFRRFWQWLRARKVEIRALNSQCVGWHSEHVNETGVIHLWDTSQVVEFLIAFRKMLQRHVARETLVLSRVKVEDPSQQPEDWRKVSETFEPMSEPTTICPRIFDSVHMDFVIPWRQNNGSANPAKLHSMLLYGPPGTGKTTIARSIADALDFRLITVTVGDFLGAGGALVEARAKAIFQMLMAQSECVILFDEVDAFLLDRDSTHYQEQDTLFKFLTPGMLTKINDLRKAQRSIFIIATNYANRIDPAIKRPGRIDRQYLLLHPDLEKREAILSKLLPKTFRVKTAQLRSMAESAVSLGFSEMSGAIEKSAQYLSVEKIVDELNQTPRSGGLGQYLARVGENRHTLSRS
jgi:hypothetical protein